MMNAILYRVSQQGRKKKKKQEILQVKKLVQVDKREQVWGGKLLLIPDINIKSDIEKTHTVEL